MSRACAFVLSLALIVPFVRAQDDDKKKKGTMPPDGLKALKHPDAKVRYRAAQTLADLGPLAKFAMPELREALKDSNSLVRVKAAEAMWKIDPPPATLLLPVLTAALKHKESGVRAAAPPVLALMGSKAKSALLDLRDALKDKELDVKLSVVAALGELGTVAKDAAGDLLDLSEDKDFFLLEPFVGASLANLGPSVLPALSKALENKSTDRRRVAAYALGAMGPSAAPAAEALAQVLKADDATTRQLAARALGKIGPDAKSSLPKLEVALADKIPAVRIEAALAAWFISKDAKHARVIIGALDDKSASVRDQACQALATMKADAQEAVEPVKKLLAEKDLRVRAVMTLGEIGAPAKNAATALRKLLEDKDGEMQLHAAFALWQVTGDTKESLKTIEKTLGTEAHYTASIVTLGEMRAAAAPMLPTLVALYREEDVPADRRALAEAIKKIDPKLAKKLGIP